MPLSMQVSSISDVTELNSCSYSSKKMDGMQMCGNYFWVTNWSSGQHRPKASPRTEAGSISRLHRPPRAIPKSQACRWIGHGAQHGRQPWGWESQPSFPALLGAHTTKPRNATPHLRLLCGNYWGVDPQGVPGAVWDGSKGLRKDIFPSAVLCCLNTSVQIPKQWGHTLTLTTQLPVAQTWRTISNNSK